MIACAHVHRSGRLSLEPPARVIVIAEMICDGCGEHLGELAAQSAEATAVAMLAPPPPVALAA